MLISFDPTFGEYNVYTEWEEPLTEYDVVVFLKASHFRNIQKNEERVMKDQDFLERFFIQAQTAGRELREQ